MSNRKIRRAAGTAGADLDAAITLSKDDTIRDRAEANMAYAKELGINGTPGIIADGIILSLGRWDTDDIVCLLRLNGRELEAAFLFKQLLFGVRISARGAGADRTG